MNTSVTLVFIERIIMAIVDNPYYVVLKSDLVIRGTFTRRKTIINDMSYYASLNIPNYQTITEIPEEHSPSGLDTSNAQNWTHAFEGMNSLKSFNLPFYNIQNAINCSNMFTNCLANNISDIQLPNSVTDISGTYAFCNLKNFPSIPTNVINMANSFYYTNIENINIDNITIPNTVTNLVGCFNHCDIGLTRRCNFYILSDNVVNANQMFNSVTPPSPDPNITVNNVYNMMNRYIYVNHGTKTYNAIFVELGKNTVHMHEKAIMQVNVSSMKNFGSITIPNYQTRTILEPTNGAQMYSYGDFYDGKIFNTTGVTDWSFAFANMSNLVSLPSNNPLNFSAATNVRALFYNCANLTSVDFTIPNTVTDMVSTYYGCYKLTSVPAISTKATNIRSCFVRTNITTAPSIPTTVTDMYQSFYNCIKLTTPPAIPANVTAMDMCFYNCANLTSMVNIPAKVTGAYLLYAGCPKLKGDCTVISNNISNAVGIVNGSTTYDKYFYVNQGTASWNSIYAGIGNTTYNATTKTHLIPFKSKYNVTFSQPSNGSITINDSSSSISVNRNTTITIKVTPNANYKLSKLLVNNVDIYDSGNTSNTYTFTVKEDTSISAVFEDMSILFLDENYYTLTNDNGVIGLNTDVFTYTEYIHALFRERTEVIFISTYKNPIYVTLIIKDTLILDNLKMENPSDNMYKYTGRGPFKLSLVASVNERVKIYLQVKNKI